MATSSGRSPSPHDIERPLVGVALCLILAAVATVAAPIFHFPVMLLVLLLGIAVRAANFRLLDLSASGIGFCTRSILRAGVALLGLRVAARDIADLGFPAIIIIITSVTMTLVTGYIFGRICRQPRDLAAIAATSVAICGASAALAASAVMPRRERLEEETALIIIIVSLLSTGVMVIYPWLAVIFHLSPRATALLLGAAIHDVAQVAGAGFSVSGEVGTQAVTVKMIRVACLLPVITGLGVLFIKRRGGSEVPTNGSLVPPFLLGFFVLAIGSSTGFLPKELVFVGGQLAGWALTISVAGIGLKTRLGELRRIGHGLLLMMIAQSLGQLSIVLILIHFMF